MYSLLDIIKKPLNDLRLIALEYGLDPGEQDLRSKLIKVLREGNQLYEEFENEIPSSFDLSNLICRRIGTEQVITTIGADECSEIGEKIVSNLIRVSASRIFVNPERAFVEPIVNSVDAYRLMRGQRTTGKFGMGFYSLFYYLLKYPDSKIKVISYPRDEVPWEISIDGDFNVRYAELEPSPRYGLTINVVINAVLSKRKTLEIYEYIFDQVKYVDDVNISLIYVSEGAKKTIHKEKYNKSFDPSVGEDILFKLDHTYYTTTLSFIDYALGIPIYDITNLLVPSLSSKTIKSSNQDFTPLVRPKTHLSKQSSELIILVGDYPVVSVKGVGFTGINYRFVCQLSPAVPVPVARDDILIDRSKVQDEFELNIYALLKEALEANPGSAPYQLLELLKEYPTGKYMVKKIIAYLEVNDYYLVPHEFYDVYRQITSRKLIGTVGILPMRTENMLIETGKIHKSNVFIGKYVYSVDMSEKISLGASTRLVFVNNNLKLNANNEMAFSLIFQEYNLLPTNAPVENYFLQKMFKRQNVRGGKKAEYIKTALDRLYGLRTIANITDVRTIIIRFISYMVNTYERAPDEYFEELLAFVYNICARYKPNTAYGSNLKRIYVSDTAKQFDNSNYWREQIMILNYLSDVASEKSIFPTSFDYQQMRIDSSGLRPDELMLLICLSYYFTFDPWEKDNILTFWNNRLRSPDNEKLIKIHCLEPTVLDNDTYLDPDTAAFESTVIKPLTVYRNLLKQTKNINLLEYQLPHLQVPQEATEYYLSRYLQDVLSGKDVSEIDNERGEVPLQILEMAINEGTVKPFIYAMMTETFQNSVDVSREGGSISISTGIKDNCLSYQITDEGGIPDVAISALSIPFLSSKKEGTGTGEIGSGFFNVYRGSYAVSISTVYQEKNTVIVDVPIFDTCSQHRVEDVHRITEAYPSGQKNGTTITVYFRSNEPKEDLTNMITFAQNVLALAHPVTVNGRQIDISKELIYSSPHTEGFRLKAYYAPDVESYILTRGVPFAPISSLNLYGFYSFLKNYILTGLVLDFQSGFEPTQSRTDLRIGNIHSYVREITNAIYLFILKRQLEEPDIEYVHNLRSTADISQILYYGTPGDDTKSLTDFIFNHIIEGNTLSELIMSLSSLWLRLSPLHLPNESSINKIQYTIAVKWVKNKGRPVNKPVIDISDKDLKQKVSGYRRLPSGSPSIEKYVLEVYVGVDALRFIRAFVEAYATTLIKVYPTLKPPHVILAELPNALATYSASDNTIRISSKLAIKEPPNKFNNIYQVKDYIDSQQKIFGKQIPASIVPHELEHWIRSSEHKGDTHQDITINGVVYNFEQSANYHYDEALMDGMFDHIVNIYNQLEI